MSIVAALSGRVYLVGISKTTEAAEFSAASYSYGDKVDLILRIVFVFQFRITLHFVQRDGE